MKTTTIMHISMTEEGEFGIRADREFLNTFDIDLDTLYVAFGQFIDTILEEGEK